MPSDEPKFSVPTVRSFIGTLKDHYRLLGALLCSCLIFAIVLFCVTPRTYQAVAVLGPPGPSPANTLLSTLSGGGITSGLASKMLGTSGGGSDPFQDFQQLLPSTRLSKALIDRDQVLQIVFHRRWDFEKRRWKSGLFRPLNDYLKRSLGLPVSNGPTVDDLTQYFNEHLKIAKAGGSATALVSGIRPYIVVSFSYENRDDAERLLSVMLSEADQIIRDHERHNVSSRIAYLRRALLNQSLAADERMALISILSDQEQLLSMVEADQRYASKLLVPPYAYLQPTFPPSLGKLMMLAAFAAIFAWVAIVLLSQHSEATRKLVAIVERR